MKTSFSFVLLLISFYGFGQYDAIKPQGIYSSSFTIDEKPRTITYYMPASYGKQEDYPLLIVLHAEKSDAAALIKKYSEAIQAKADSAGCIVLYPDAYKGHWNSSPQDTVNDVGFINIMSEFFLRQFNCDLGQIRLLGVGSGGNLCYRFACESNHKPLSIATVGAAANDYNFLNCNASIAIHKANVADATNVKSAIEQSLNILFTRKRVQ